MPNLATTVQKLANPIGVNPMQVMICSVVSVDKKARTVNVTPVTDNLAAFPAQLMSDVADGLLIVPTVGSTVKVMLSETATPTVIQYSEVDEVFFVAGGSTFKIQASDVELQGSSFGGLVKVVPTVSALVTIQNDINSLKLLLATLVTATAALPPAIPVLGATLTSLFSPFATYSAATLTPTIQSDIENIKVKHGNG